MTTSFTGVLSMFAKKSRKGLATALALTGLTSIVQAAPSGGEVVAGDASISAADRATIIQQLSQKAIIDWNEFNISADELVQFLQPNANAVALNRVVGNQPSDIFGSLLANGNIFLVNPNGILFGANSTIDVAGLMATTFDISNEDFLSGNFNFAQKDGFDPSFIANYGKITVGNDGFVYLVAPNVKNAGLIVAELGQVALASGDQFSIDFAGDGLIKFDVSGKVMDEVKGADGETLAAGVTNSGEIRAQGGHVLLTASDARGIMTSVVNNTGVIEATSLDGLTGSVELSGGNVANMGTINVDGVEGNAGDISLLAGENVVLGNNSVTSANGGTYGDGGNILVIGQTTARIASGAVLNARGGSLGGDGGFVETSGHQGFEIGSNPDVFASAGQNGQWLIDPANIEIVAGNANVEINNASPFETIDIGAQLGVDLILAALANGEVIITTTTAGGNSEDGNIFLSTNLSYTGIDSQLTLNAHNDIILNGAITSTNALSLVFNANSNVGGGEASGTGSVFFNNSIDTAGGDLTTSGINFTSSDTSNVNVHGGTLTIDNTGDVLLDGHITAGSFGAITVENATNIEVAGTVGSTATNVSLQADEMLTANAGGTVSGAYITLRAGTGIGTSTNAFQTNASHGLTGEVSGEGGDIYLSQQSKSAGYALGINNGNVELNTKSSGGDDVALNYTAGGVLTADNPLDGTLIFTNTGGGVQLGNLDLGNGEYLSLAAAGDITHDSGIVTADDITFTVTKEGHSIGAENAALKVDATSNLSAYTQSGNIIITDVADSVILGEIHTGGDKGESDTTRALITAEDGGIFNTDGLGVVGTINIHAWATNLVAKGEISVNTQVSVLSASTYNGDIWIDQVGDVILGNISARENGLSPFADADGNIVLDADGTIGNRRLYMTVDGNAVIGGTISATNEINIQSTNGAILDTTDSVDFISRLLYLKFEEGIGLEGNPIDTNVEQVWLIGSRGDVYLTEVNGLRIGDIGAQNDINIQVNSGNISIYDGSVWTVDANDSSILINSERGSITYEAGVDTGFKADSVSFLADKGVGTSASPINTNTNNLSVFSKTSGGLFVNNAGTFDTLAVNTPNGDVSIGFTGGPLTFNSGTRLLSMAGVADFDLSFFNPKGHVVLGGLNIGTGNLAIYGAKGVGQPENYLSVDTINLAADGGTGGVYINHNSHDHGLNIVEVTPGLGLDPLSGVSTQGGNIEIVTGGSLNIHEDVSNTDGGDIVLSSDDSVNQNANISVDGSGDVTVIAKNDITMGPDAETSGETGLVTYEAGDEIALTKITVSDGSNGGGISITADNIVDNNPGEATLEGGYISINSPMADKNLLKQLLDDNFDAAIINLNGRTVGGRILEENQFLGAFFYSVDDMFNFGGPESSFNNFSSDEEVEPTTFIEGSENAGVWQFN